MRRHLLRGLSVGLLGVVAAKFFASAAPLGGWGNGLDNLWTLVHIPAYLVAVLIDGNPHGGGHGPVLVGVFLQWFAVGWIGSWIWGRINGGAAPEADEPQR